MLSICRLGGCVAEVIDVYLEELGRAVGLCSGRDVGYGHYLFDGVMWEVGFVADEVLGEVPSTLCDRAEIQRTFHPSHLQR